jgi:outer membrane protein assembly factor BamB
MDFGGRRQYVQFLATTVAGVSATDGRLLWRYDKPANGMKLNISTPIHHEGHIFAASAYGAGGGLAKLSTSASGEMVANEVWFSKNMENHHGGVILHDSALFGANGGNGGGYLACLDFKTGEVLWNERDSDKRRVTKGSVAFADGRIYYRTEEGPVVLIEPSRKEYLERGRFTQPERTDKPAWAHPVIANGRLYIRDQGTLFCYDVKAK